MLTGAAAVLVAVCWLVLAVAVVGLGRSAALGDEQAERLWLGLVEKRRDDFAVWEEELLR